MSPPIIRGSFTEVPSVRGRDGIRIRESGMAAPTFPSGSVSESASSAATAGAGVAGASIGTTTTRFITTTGTTQPAERFTTGTLTTGEAHALGLMVAAADLVAAMSRGIGLPMLAAAVFTTARAVPVGPLKETTAPLEATRNPVVRPARAPMASAITTMAVRPEVILHAEAPASVASVVAVAEHLAVVVGAAAAGITKGRNFLPQRVQCEFREWRKPYAACEFELRQIYLGQSC